MKIISTTPVEVELTEAEQVISEWLDTCLNEGYAPQFAIRMLLDMTPAEGIWHRLLTHDDNQAFYFFLVGDREMLEYEFHMQQQVEELESRCGATMDYGPSHDPSRATCDLAKNHPLDTKHAGPAEGGRVEWRGGGSCAGDPVRPTDVKFTA